MWTHEMVKDYFDSNLNITLKELSIKSGYSVKELKQILMGKG
jgi:beta-N-acetylglucosaminidase